MNVYVKVKALHEKNLKQQNPYFFSNSAFTEWVKCKYIFV